MNLLKKLRVTPLAEDSEMTLGIPARFPCFECPFCLGCVSAVTQPVMIKAEFLPAKLHILLCSTHFVLYFSSSDSFMNHRSTEILSWKGHIRITRSDPWPCPGQPREFRPCLSYYLIPPTTWQAQENGFTLRMQIWGGSLCWCGGQLGSVETAR